jgi:carbonic anhydrase/acetyltransferase-like protein (isoleucine patch superfamily)
MSLNRLPPAQLQPEIASSASLLGNVHVGAGAIVSQGTVGRSHDESVSIGNYSAVLDKGVVVGTCEHPVRIGQRTVSGHRARIITPNAFDRISVISGHPVRPRGC